MRKRVLSVLTVVAALGVLASALAGPGAWATLAGRPGEILFDGGAAGCGRCLYTVDPSTGRLRELTAGDEGKFSPDGGRIVFIKPARGPSRPRSFIAVMNADGSDPHVVLGGDHTLRTPSFSPDGHHLLYTAYSERSGRTGIWSARADGSHRRLLHSLDGGAQFPSYSPNGKVIVFQAGNLLYTMRPDGSRLRVLTAGAAPSISPRGHLVVYSNKGGIWTIHLDGSHRRLRKRQFSSGQHEQVRGKHVRNVNPTFSPDGKLILFARVGNKGSLAVRSKLWVMRRDGSGMRRVAQGGVGSAYRPEWQPR